MNSLCLTFAAIILSVAPHAESASFVDFPEAKAFPESPAGDGEWKQRKDLLGATSHTLVRLKTKMRVGYESGRVTTVYAASKATVGKNSELSIRLMEPNRILRVKLVGVQQGLPEGYTHEEFYGWKGGQLHDIHGGGRVVTLAEHERHSLDNGVFSREFWCEFDGEPPTPPYGGTYSVILYNIKTNDSLNETLIRDGYAHADRNGKRSSAWFRRLEDSAASYPKGLWDEKRWREQEVAKEGFDYLKISPAARVARNKFPGSRPPSSLPSSKKRGLRGFSEPKD